MPALVPYPQVLKVRVGFSSSADTDIGTTLHFEYSGTAPTDATCLAIANAIEALAVTNLIPLCMADVGLTGVQVTDLTSPTSGFGENTTHTSGTRSGSALPAGVCALMGYTIARRYRGGKPRSYWPFGTASDVSNGQTWTSGFITAVESGVAAFISGVEAITSSGTILGDQVSISYYEGFVVVTNPITGRSRNAPKPRTVAIAPDVILSQKFNNAPASQRRRNQTV